MTTCKTEGCENEAKFQRTECGKCIHKRYSQERKECAKDDCSDLAKIRSTLCPRHLKARQQAAKIKSAGEKKCKHCQKVKPLQEFGADKSRTDGLNTNCRDCNAAIWRERFTPKSNGRQEIGTRLGGSMLAEEWARRAIV